MYIQYVEVLILTNLISHQRTIWRCSHQRTIWRWL